jgi:hypothetical protein
MRYLRILAVCVLAGCATTEAQDTGLNWDRIQTIAVGTAVVVTLAALSGF